MGFLFFPAEFKRLSEDVSCLPLRLFLQKKEQEEGILSNINSSKKMEINEGVEF